MTPQEALQAIRERVELRMVSIPDVDAMLDALTAVLDLHPCWEGADHGQRPGLYCAGDCTTDGHRQSWPCDTVRAITEALS